MQGAGTLCLQLLGEGKSLEAKTCVGGVLAAAVPAWKKEGHSSCYSWYYMTQAIFHGGKDGFKRWNATFAPMLVKNQMDDGHWENPGAEKKKDDKKKGHGYEAYMATAMNALSLQVYYRYLPTYKEPTKIAKAEDDIFGLDEDL